MSPPAPQNSFSLGRREESESSVPNVVVVDPRFDCYKPLAASARLGKLNLHFRSSGSEAMKLARRGQVHVWLVGTELEDMSGNDFLELLQSRFGAPGSASTRVAVVADAGSGRGPSGVAAREPIEAGADTVLSSPITFRDLEVLLGVASGGRPTVTSPVRNAARAFVTLPIGVGAAVLAIAVLILS